MVLTVLLVHNGSYRVTSPQWFLPCY